MSIEEYNIIQEICGNICKDKGLVEDLIQEVALIFLELDRAQQEKTRKYFRYWVIRVVSNQYKSNTSPFWTKYRRTINVDPAEIYDLTEDPHEIEEGPDKQDILDKLISELFISDQNVFVDYYHKNMTIMQITTKYNVEKTFVWSTIERIRQSLRRRSEWLLNVDPNLKVKLSETIANYVGRSRLKVEERQMIIDTYNHLTGSKVNATHDRELVNQILLKLIRILSL